MESGTGAIDSNEDGPRLLPLVEQACLAVVLIALLSKTTYRSKEGKQILSVPM